MSVLIDITPEAIIFKTELKKGVAWIPPRMYNIAKNILKSVDRQITACEGDFETTSFIIDPPLTEEELDFLEEHLGTRPRPRGLK